VVQQSLHTALSPLLDREFLDCSFAYRPGRSALQAIDRVEQWIKDGYQWVLCGDVENCMEGMSYREEYLGVEQGNVISPLLANLYLHSFDQAIMSQGYHLVRYADNLLIMEQSQETIGRALTDTFYALDNIKLKLNESKTRVVNIREGIVFLGYYLDADGKQASDKALQVINLRLANLARVNQKTPLPQKVALYRQVLRGWMNYFRNCRGIAIALGGDAAHGYAAPSSAARGDAAHSDAACRNAVHDNAFPCDASLYLAILELSIEANDQSYALQLLKERNKFSSPNLEFGLRLGRISRISPWMSSPGYCPGILTVSLQPRRPGSSNPFDSNYQKRIERLRKIIHCAPDLPQAYQDLSICYAEGGEFGLAWRRKLIRNSLSLRKGRKANALPWLTLCLIVPY
jgi:hypothetical protein